LRGDSPEPEKNQKSGRPSGALRWLHKAADARRWVLASSVSVEPFFNELHGDPEFERLLRRLGLQRSK
jgi:hypothetical protein